jgi:hypothetical protein
MDANRTPTALVRGVHHFTLSCGNGYQEALIGDYQANCVFQAVASPLTGFVQKRLVGRTQKKLHRSGPALLFGPVPDKGSDLLNSRASPP